MSNRLHDLIEHNAQRILRLVSLESNGEASSPDIYESNITNNIESLPQKRIKYEFTESYARNEPRLDLIRKSLERLAKYGSFSENSKILPIDGFSLYDLKNWANYGPITIQQNVGDLSSYCNCKCEFCYEMGAKKADIPWRRMMLSRQEAKTRIKYYSPETQKGLIPATNYTLEPFTNPHAMEIIEMMRKAEPKSWLYLFTNGSLLTEKIIKRLAELQPIIIVISLNASSPEVWVKTMRGSEKDAESAFRALELLRKYEIPTIGSYVPWPSKPISDLYDAVILMDKLDVMRARICLPTFTRFHDGDIPFDPDTYWTELLNAVQYIRQEVRVPVAFMPALYEVNTILPIVHGIMKNSPAEKADIRFGDRIVAIDGEKVYTIPETRGLLGQRAMEADKYKSTTFTIERNGDIFDITIRHPEDPEKTKFPYKAFAKGGHTRYSNSLGIHFTDGFQLTYIVKLAEICEEYKGKKVLVLTSVLMEPHFLEAFEMAGDMFGSFRETELYVGKPLPEFFGGSVVLGDLWMVSDLISYTEKWINDTGICPDVVIAPSSFLSVGKRDLLGHNCFEFERELDIELRLMLCTPIAE